MVRSLRSISKEDASSILADSGISLSSPPAPRNAPKKTLCTDANLSDDDLDGGSSSFDVPSISNGRTHDEDEDEDDEDEDYENTSSTTSSDSDRKTTSKNAKSTTSAKTNRKGKTTSKSNRKRKSSNTKQKAKQNQSESLVESGKQQSTEVIGTEQTETQCDQQSRSGSKRRRKQHICEVCNKEFGGKTDLKRHVLIHSNERPHKCEECGKCYRQRVNLKNHITAAHKRQKQFVCNQCSKAFALKERLRLHMRIHSGDKPYKCSLCDKCYARGGQLQQHKLTHHNKDSAMKRFHCEKCSAGFSTAANLRAHMERHEQGPEFKCKICNELFIKDTLLQEHINRVHQKLKQFDCKACKKTIEDGDPIAHLKQHSHIKMHICEVCNGFFNKKSQYNVHMRMHTGERPYQCKICWQTFAHSSVLKLHIRKHTGEKPFNCLLCKTDEVAFSQLAHLKTHMIKIHEQSKPYMCEGCNNFFKVKSELQVHMENCRNCQRHGKDHQANKQHELETLSHLRFLVALLLKKISTEQKLQQLGYEKRLIDNVLVTSLKLANRKTHDDSNLEPIERMRSNIEEFLNWIVPGPVMKQFQEKQKLNIDSILEKIVTMHTTKTK